MSTAAPPEPVTLPEEALYEVVNGQRIDKPMSAEASWITSLLQILFGGHVLTHRLGWPVSETMFVLDPATDLRRRPDVAFVSADRWPLDRDPPADGDWEVVPDLAVEVVSPNDSFRDVDRKIREYLGYGVREVWVVSPAEQQVYVHTARDAVRVVVAPADLETPLVPGWRLSLGSLFRVPAK
jgi:Uma2 family endonuclease